MCVSLINIKTDNEIKTPSQTIWKYIDSSQQKQAATVGQGEDTHRGRERGGKEAKARCGGRAWACENISLECRVAVKILLLGKQVELVEK